MALGLCWSLSVLFGSLLLCECRVWFCQLLHLMRFLRGAGRAAFLYLFLALIAANWLLSMGAEARSCCFLRWLVLGLSAADAQRLVAALVAFLV